MVDQKNILKLAKSSYQELTKENKQLKQCITNIKQQQYQQQQYQQQKIYTRPKKYKKLFMKNKQIMRQNRNNKKHQPLKR